MIARIWHGRVPTPKAHAYRELLNRLAIPNYRAIDGNLNVYILERADGDVTHFITLTFWRDMDSIKQFAGENAETAKYYPEDSAFLIEFEPTVLHYEIVGQAH